VIKQSKECFLLYSEMYFTAEEIKYFLESGKKKNSLIANKIGILTYYWPPSGDSGVQR